MSGFFLRPPAAQGGADGAVGAGFYALAAADALGAVGRLVGADAEAAGAGTEAAVHALFAVHLVAVERDGVEKSVDRSQRAEIAAKRPVHHHGEQQQDDQYGDLPVEDPTQRRLQRRIRGDERNARKERAARADVLAVPGAALAYHV